MKKGLSILLLIICTKAVFATAQVPDILIIDQDTHAIFSDPLETYLNQQKNRITLNLNPITSTACWRGYQAVWRLRNDSLFLIRIMPCLASKGDKSKDADLAQMFGEDYRNSQVFAKWASLTLQLPEGELVEYIHLGYGSIYERDRKLLFKKGVLHGDTTYYNLPNGFSPYRRNNELLTAFLQSQINWNAMPDIPSDGRKSVQAVIYPNEKGKIDSVALRKGIGAIFNKEAFRVLRLIPKWEVVYQKGKPGKKAPYLVNVSFEKKRREKHFIPTIPIPPFHSAKIYTRNQHIKQFLHKSDSLSNAADTLMKNGRENKAFDMIEHSSKLAQRAYYDRFSTIIQGDKIERHAVEVSHLSDIQINKLKTILGPWPSPAEKTPSTACIPTFRDAIVFFDKKGNIVGSIDLCFECDIIWVDQRKS
ncbi:MAG: hypothetical protein AB8F95_08265, partial [Bacteroidia bacterium]